MSTIVVAAILIASTILISLLFNFIHNNKEKKKQETVLNLFSEAGSMHRLSFSSYEVLRNKVIGLDGLKRMLLIFEISDVNKINCISLDDVSSCTLSRQYDNINMGSEKQARIERHLSSIDIRFDFRNGSDPVNLPFYESAVNSIYEMQELETKAKNWELLLSKMISKENKARA